MWLLVLLGCVHAPQPALGQAVPGPELPPAGFGSLRQEDVAIRLRGDKVIVTVLPLDERVTRLLAPDSYSALHQLVESRTDEITGAARNAGYAAMVPFLVMVYALDDQVPFDPDDLTLLSRGRSFRPGAVLPVSARWGEYRLPRRETASGIFLFDDAVDVFAPMTVVYASVMSTAWESTLRRLEVERTRVEARARGPGLSLH